MCNCRSVEECSHKFADISQEELNEIVIAYMRSQGQIPKSDREKPTTPQEPK